jgi:hypothetical protein
LPIFDWTFVGSFNRQSPIDNRQFVPNPAPSPEP